MTPDELNKRLDDGSTIKNRVHAYLKKTGKSSVYKNRGTGMFYRVYPYGTAVIYKVSISGSSFVFDVIL